MQKIDGIPVSFTRFPFSLKWGKLLNTCFPTKGISSGSSIIKTSIYCATVLPNKPYFDVDIGTGDQGDGGRMLRQSTQPSSEKSSFFSIS